MLELIITSVISVLSALGVREIIAHFLNNRKNKAEARSVEVANKSSASDIYQKDIDYLSERIDRAYKTISTQENAIRIKTAELSKLNDVIIELKEQLTDKINNIKKE